MACLLGGGEGGGGLGGGGEGGGGLGGGGPEKRQPKRYEELILIICFAYKGINLHV